MRDRELEPMAILASCVLGRKNTPKRTPSPCHMAQLGHSTPETIPEMTHTPRCPRLHLDKHISGGKIEEKEKQKGVCTIKRGETGGLRVVRNGLM